MLAFLWQPVDDAARAAIVASGIDHACNRQFMHVATASQCVLSKIMPQRVLAPVKRQMCRDTRKLQGVKVLFTSSTFLSTTWNVFQHCHLSTLTRLSLSTRCLALSSLEQSWQKEMERQGCDPMSHGQCD